MKAGAFAKLVFSQITAATIPATATIATNSAITNIAIPTAETQSSDLLRYHLSDRGQEILILLGKGLKNRETAQQLYLAEGTVKNYISRILSEMEMRDRTQAALWVQKNL